MKEMYDVAVIGGGIIGCSIAYHLAKNNIQTVVIEAEQMGGKATNAAAGMLGAHSESPDLEGNYSFARQSQLLYQSLQTELKEISGIDIQYRTGGLLNLFFEEKEKEAYSKIMNMPTVAWLSREEVIERDNRVSPSIIGALDIPSDVHVMPTYVCHAFQKSAQILGAHFKEFTTVLSVEKESNNRIIRTSKGNIYAKKVIIANGVWSTYFFEQLGLTNRLVPVKGECLSVINDKLPLNQTLFHHKSYIVPRNNNQLIIGATEIVNDWSNDVSVTGINNLIKKAETLMPSIGEYKIQSFWSGLRPQTLDGNPYIGYHPEDEDILFATGHYRNGILMAPATGQMITDLILENLVDEAWLDAFRIDRKEKISI